MRKLFVALLVFVTAFSALSFQTVTAKTAYKTRTVNRYGELIDTQDAYTPNNLINSFNDGDLLLNPQDMFITEDDHLFIVDTGNKRIVELDEEYNYINHFGETELVEPKGIYIRDEVIYIADYELGAIVKYTMTGDLIEVLDTPDSPILGIDDFVYKPEKIAVDENHTMYVVSEGSSEGILQVNEDNRFLSFFAPNNVDGTVRDLVLDFFYGDNENANIIKKIPVTAHNIMLNDNGYIYTVSQFKSDGGTGDALKKVNIGGENFFSDSMYMDELFEDVWPGNHGNLYAVSQEGFIYEYDSLGNLLFLFAGNNEGTELPGLFSSASAVVVNSNGEVLVLDNNKNNIQVFRPTNFVSQVHEALKLYEEGKYIESIEPWQEVLRYNSLFDMAHRGIGLAYLRQGNYEQALEEFEISNYKSGYSESYWEMRNEWLLGNVPLLLLIFAIIQVYMIVYRKFLKQTNVVIKTKEVLKKTFSKGYLQELRYMFRYLRNPNDAVYEVRRKHRVSIKTALSIVLAYFIVYVCYILFTGFLFNPFIVEETILLQEVIKLFVPLISFAIANFLISSLMDGEGTFKSIFIGTIGAMLPMLIIIPITIVVSNILSYNEEFIYYFMFTIASMWSAVMLFFIIKETHNFSTFQTIVNFVLTALMMVVIILVVIIVYILIFQVYSFVADIIREVIING